MRFHAEAATLPAPDHVPRTSGLACPAAHPPAPSTSPASRTINELTAGAPISFIASEIKAERMISDLRESNDIVITTLLAAFKATNDPKPGLSDFLQSRLDTHAKWAWMLRATEGA